MSLPADSPLFGFLNIEPADGSIKQFVYDKLGGLQKFYPQVQLFEVELRADDKHRKGYFYAEVNATVPGTLLRATEKHEDLYACAEGLTLEKG